MFVATVQPVVIQHILGRYALVRRLLKHFLHQIDGAAADNIFLEFDLLTKLLYLAEISDLVSFERDVAVQHSIQADACAPYVHREPFVPHILHYFWSYVGWSSALLKQNLILLNLLRNSKVSNLDVPVAIQEYVIQLDISMSNFVSM